MQDIMLDLETMGSGPNAAIVSIGAVEFNLETGHLGESFYQVITLSTSVQYGGVMDADTVLWWLRQDDEARQAIARPGVHITVALVEFTKWLNSYNRDVNNVKMWGNGAAFDNVILASAYRNNMLPQPWKHWNDRCYRTVKSQHRDVKLVRTGTHHNALDDAISQAQHLIAMLPPAVQTPATR